MDIFELIKGDHADIRSLLNEIIHQTSAPISEHKRILDKPEDWEEALHDLKLELVGHNRAEEAILYTRLRELPNGFEMMKDEIHEHHVAEELLEALEHINPRDRDWDAKIGLLKNQIESHQAEEEGTTFDLLRPDIDAETSARLARDFESLRDDIIEGAKYHPKGRSNLNPAGLDLET